MIREGITRPGKLLKPENDPRNHINNTKKDFYFELFRGSFLRLSQLRCLF